MVLTSDDPTAHRKPCTLCHTPRDVLIRCQIDETATWHLICPGKCWTAVSGGKVDGDSAHPHYRYGGMWKNRYADVTAKRPKSSKNKAVEQAGQNEDEEKEVRDKQGEERAEKGRNIAGVDEWKEEKKYTTNDRVVRKGIVWVCRKSHKSREGKGPGENVACWKEDDVANGVRASMDGKSDRGQEIEGGVAAVEAEG